MRKKFPFKTCFFKKNKKENQNINNDSEQNLVYCTNFNVYNVLDFWSDVTRWSLGEFQNILTLTDITFPITMYDVDSNNVLLCKDGNNDLFSLTLKFNSSFAFSELIIEYEKEMFHYNLISKLNYLNNFPKLAFKSYTKVSEDSSKVFEITFKSNNNITLSEEMLINVQDVTYEYHYVTDIELLETDKKEILDNILKSDKLEENFEDTKTVYDLLKNVIKSLKLTKQELNALKITMSLSNNNILLSKIILKRNIISELLFFTEKGCYNLFSDDKLIFVSADKEVSITINNLSKILEKQPICIKKIDEIINEANDMLNEMKNYKSDLNYN